LSGPSLDLIAPIRPLQLCADGGYQLRLGVLGVPLIMVPDNNVHYITGDSFSTPLETVENRPYATEGRGCGDECLASGKFGMAVEEMVLGHGRAGREGAPGRGRARGEWQVTG
jgi:hypothetical protein